MDTASFALIAHDLKNALGILEGQLEAMIDDPTPAMAHGAYLRCTELRRQFVQFLTMYGAKEGLRAMSEDESPIELIEAIQRAGMARRLVEPGAPKIALATPEEAPAYWYFDRRLVQMALDAAFHNASRFARETITLSVREENGCLVFAIDDDGDGLGAQDPSKSSTGLGTTLCRAVAQAHHCGERHGEVRLFNRPEGTGARFELWLP